MWNTRKYWPKKKCIVLQKLSLKNVNLGSDRAISDWIKNLPPSMWVPTGFDINNLTSHGPLNRKGGEEYKVSPLPTREIFLFRALLRVLLRFVVLLRYVFLNDTRATSFVNVTQNPLPSLNLSSYTPVLDHVLVHPSFTFLDNLILDSIFMDSPYNYEHRCTISAGISGFTIVLVLRTF